MSSSVQIQNEPVLFARIAEGDEAAFTELFLAYGRLLHPFISRLLKSPAHSEEIMQQVFLRLWLKRDTLTEIDNPRAYIFRMTANACFGELRKKVAEAKTQAAIKEENTIQEEEATTKLAISEINQLIQQAVNSLAPQQKRIFLLSRREKLTISEIATQLSLSPSTVKNTLVNALKAIRLALEKAGYLLPAILPVIFL